MDRTLCGVELATMEPLWRVKVVERLLVQRLLRKSARVVEMWERAERDWNQTLYQMTAYAMGAPRNSRPFERLAERVSYLMCLRERGSLVRVEAMLLGASGLLRGEFFDDYIVRLQEEYDYLAAKYSLRTMNAGEWSRGGNFPAGGPVMRIAQLAAIVAREEYSVDALLAIRTLSDVERLFDVRAGEYWQKRYTPDGRSAKGAGHIGREKVNMLAINLVVPMQFAYGEVMHNEDIKAQALDLLEQIPSEHNRVVARWTGEGVPSGSAYDSQALIELSHLCDEGGCSECPLAKQLKKA